MKLRKTQSATLTLDDGSCHKLTYLGKGLTHDAWRNDNNAYLISRPVKNCEDYSKEILTGRIYSLESPHFPKIAYLGDLDGTDHRVYRMPFYEKLTAAHKAAWEQFKWLNSTMEHIRRQYSHKLAGTGQQICNFGYDMAQDLAERTKAVYPELGEALGELANAAGNYGSSYTFEFNRSNLSVEGETLILRDVVYNIECVEAKYARH